MQVKSWQNVATLCYICRHVSDPPWTAAAAKREQLRPQRSWMQRRRASQQPSCKATFRKSSPVTMPLSFPTERSRRTGRISSETVRAQAVLDVGQKALQELLYDLESRTPYVFVDVMAVQPPSTTALRATQEPVLRLTLACARFGGEGQHETLPVSQHACPGARGRCHRASPAQPPLQEQTPSTPTVDLANPVTALSLDRLSVTRERPLFSPSRRPPPPPAVPIASAPPPPPPPPNLTLFGVVMDDEDARAVVQTGTGSKIRRVRIGDDIDGWKVSQIEQRRLVLSLDSRLATFTMFARAANPAPHVAGKPAPASPPAQGPAQRDRRGY